MPPRGVSPRQLVVPAEPRPPNETPVPLIPLQMEVLEDQPLEPNSIVFPEDHVPETYDVYTYGLDFEAEPFSPRPLKQSFEPEGPD